MNEKSLRGYIQQMLLCEDNVNEGSSRGGVDAQVGVALMILQKAHQWRKILEEFHQ